MAKLLVIDNQRSIRKNLTELLENEKYAVTTSDNTEECKNLLIKNKYDLVIYNAYMPDLDGIGFLNFLKNKDVDVAVIMSADHFEVDDVIKCMREGAYDFIERPCNLHKLLFAVRNALSNISLKKECRKLHVRVIETIPEIMGTSPQMQAIKKMIQKVSKCESRVLITGANGTGKELVARWLHELSNRKASPLIEVNCAAIPNELIESELFGHEKGSFTSADSKRIGKFEQADGGTLFLDEIGDMSLSAQAKVLRALQENKIGRVGGVKDIDVDVRVIAATNKNLREEITKGNFREDLYHRLNVIQIHVPSLAERKEDIPQLINQFNESLSKRRGVLPKVITEEAISALQNRAWTGNIRELQNMVERLIILCDDTVTSEDISTYCLCE